MGVMSATYDATSPEIPYAYADFENISSDDPATLDRPQPATLWRTVILDGGDQAYVVHIRGLDKTYGSLCVGATFQAERGSGAAFANANKIVAAWPGVERQFLVHMDPGATLLAVDRLGSPDDLARTVEVFCAEGLLDKKGECQSLQAKADAARAATARGNREAARGELRAFLHELDALVKTGKVASEVTGAPLREEAEAALVALKTPPMPKANSGKPKAGVPARPAK
jgi:hypothetical protein